MNDRGQPWSGSEDTGKFPEKIQISNSETSIRKRNLSKCWFQDPQTPNRETPRPPECHRGNRTLSEGEMTRIRAQHALPDSKGDARSENPRQKTVEETPGR